VKKIILWAALLWACGDVAGRRGAEPDGGIQPGLAPSEEGWREPERPFHSDAGAPVSTCDSSNGACRLDGVPPPQGPGSPEPVEPDRPNGPAPDPSPIDAPAPAAARR
jgi:hypothetical protein